MKKWAQTIAKVAVQECIKNRNCQTCAFHMKLPGATNEACPRCIFARFPILSYNDGLDEASMVIKELEEEPIE